MTMQERETLERLRDFSRDLKELLGPPPSKEVWGQNAAALDAALRELDAAEAMRAELPGLVRTVWAGCFDDGPGRDAWRRLCELLPGLEGDGPPR